MEENGEKSQRRDEVFTGNRAISVDIIIKVRNAICKIILKEGENECYGTGFFMKVYDYLKYLIINYHVINPDIIKNKIIDIEIWNQKKMKLNVLNRKKKFFEKPKDITIIEIHDFDEIYKDIEFLDYDKNYYI